MAKIKEKFEAISLRKRGRSIKEISSVLQVSKSIVSNWCRDVALTQKQIENLVEKRKRGGMRGVLIAAEKKRFIRLKEEEFFRQKGIKDVGKLNKRDLFIAGVAMYWAEGYTYSSGCQFGFTNSDPVIIKLILKWLKNICGISKDRIALAVRMNQEHKERILEIESYWSKITGLPINQFNKTIFIKSKFKKIFPDDQKKNYFGTLRITIKNGTQLRRKIAGWIEGLSML
ncbi:helix-turn-helix domain-containing protein [Candidatus Gribaldobacteria bacterium]|nr:helix-turn-helix domain-containing protein [Candidatus Gribaldobacteria bacterium]